MDEEEGEGAWRLKNEDAVLPPPPPPLPLLLRFVWFPAPLPGVRQCRGEG